MDVKYNWSFLKYLVGKGYVGLVSGACFSDMGNNVTCIDVNEKKIYNLNNGIIPIYELGLKEMVDKNVLVSRLKFTINLLKAGGKLKVYDPIATSECKCRIGDNVTYCQGYV